MIPFSRPGLFWAALIIAFGTLYSMYFGYHGLHPLDSGIVFQGAWSRFCDRDFIVDVDTPNGFVPMALQTVFFQLLGVNWFSYTLHAGLFNGGFGVLVFWILRMAGQDRLWAGLLGMLSCVAFYPPMGGAYMEQHAFFFLLLGVGISIKSFLSEGRSFYWLTFLPVTWVLAILSKQNPGLWAPVLTVIAVACYVRRVDMIAALKAIGVGMIPVFFCGNMVAWQCI